MKNTNINFSSHNVYKAKANIVQEQNKSVSNNQETVNHQSTKNNEQTKIAPSLIFNYETAKMDNLTILRYLQSLMNLPNSIEKFINQHGEKNIDKNLAKIFIENFMSVEALNIFLNKNSNNAISKLMNIISESLKNNINSEQLRDVLSILNSIQNSTQTNIQQNINSIKELFLIYIPLNLPVFNKNIELNEEEKEIINSQNKKTSLLISTINLSNIICCFEEDNQNIFIDIYCDENFPDTKLKDILNSFTKELNYGLIYNFIKNKKTNKTKEQNFKINSSNFVSTKVLLLLHLIIKVIFKFDDDFKQST